MVYERTGTGQSLDFGRVWSIASHSRSDCSSGGGGADRLDQLHVLVARPRRPIAGGNAALDRGAFPVLTEAAVGLAIFGVPIFAFNRPCARHIPAVASLADAAYTLYLLHYLCVWLVFAALGGRIASY